MSGYNSKKWIAKKNKEADGPYYEKSTMLRFFELLRSTGIPDDFKLGYKTDARTEEAAGAADDEATAEAKREALREVLKNQKLAKAKAKAASKAAGTPKNQQAQRPPGAPPMLMPGMPYMGPAPQMGQMFVPPMPYLCPLWGSKATVRLSNVPRAYKQETLAALLVWRFRGALDFLFLPEGPEGSPEGSHNCGYAFLNFRVMQGATDFTTAYNNVSVSTAFPGSQPDADESDKVCKVQKIKTGVLDKLVDEARQRASNGKASRLPILVDLWGNARPIPTADVASAAQAAAAAAAAAAMSAAALSGNTASAQLRQQIEYYFSFENMCRDVFLRSKMDEDGWVPMELIAGFNKVKVYNVNATSLGAYLQGSEVVEVDIEKHRIRQKDAQQRVMWELKAAVDGKDDAKESAEKSEEASEAK